VAVCAVTVLCEGDTNAKTIHIVNRGREDGRLRSVRMRRSAYRESV